VRRLAGHFPNQEEKGECQRETPESCRDGTDVGQPDQPRAKGQCNIAEKKRRKSEAVRVGCVAGQERSPVVVQDSMISNDDLEDCNSAIVSLRQARKPVVQA
jgi:hypothetical protein